MRKAFVKILTQEAKKNQNIFLLTADLGFMLFEGFAKKFPDRFINIGVAEANMISAASGLALSGKTVITYSIANFTTIRVLEQIRNDLCYQNADVKVVGVGAGFAYDHDGFTHYNLEDIAVMRALPNITILSPADPIEAELATKAMLYQKGPVYLRLGKTGEPRIYKKEPNFSVGKGIVIQEGKDATILASGNIIHNAIKASLLLKKRGVEIEIISLHTIKPLDRGLIIRAAKKTGCVFTIEEHSIIGGLGSAVAEVISESRIKGLKFKRLGIPDKRQRIIGSQQYLRQKHFLSPQKITQQVLSVLAARPSS